MTAIQKIALRQSEIRTRLHELGEVEDQTDETRSEIKNLTTEMKDLETRSQALIAAGEQPEEEPEGEQRDEQLVDLARRANLGEVFEAALEHRSTDGATRELQDEFGVQGHQIPLAMLETRDVTPAPSNVGQNQAEIIPGVFPMSCAAYLGVDIPDRGRRRSRLPGAYAERYQYTRRPKTPKPPRRPDRSAPTCCRPPGSRRRFSTRVKIGRGSPVWTRRFVKICLCRSATNWINRSWLERTACLPERTWRITT